MNTYGLIPFYRWETGHLIPGLPIGQPDHGYCLFHQKLQMINCCILKKISREKASEQAAAGVTSTGSGGGSAAESTDEEEFFECCDDEDEAEEETAVAPGGASVPEWDREPHGRLEKFGNVKLLERPDEQMYVPECQDPSPMTEDMMAEQAEVRLCAFTLF